MPACEITLRDEVTGFVCEVTLPDDETIEVLLEAICRKLGLEESTDRRLRNKTQGFEYSSSCTLSSKGTNQSDLCLLSYEPVFGGPELAAGNRQPSRSYRALKSRSLAIDIRTISPLTHELLKRDEGSIALIAHSHHNLEERCAEQRAEIEILRRGEESTRVSTALFLLAQIVVAFGVALATQGTPGGWLVLTAGVLILLGGLFFVSRPSPESTGCT